MTWDCWVRGCHIPARPHSCASHRKAHVLHAMAPPIAPTSGLPFGQCSLRSESSPSLVVASVAPISGCPSEVDVWRSSVPQTYEFLHARQLCRSSAQYNSLLVGQQSEPGLSSSGPCWGYPLGGRNTWLRMPLEPIFGILYLSCFSSESGLGPARS